MHDHHPYNPQERKTCLPCRRRKVKCDGRSPKCGPCSAAKREMECVFPPRPENRDKRNALPKGKACRSCRGKKKKCDGQHPICSTCSRSRDGQPCIYDEVDSLPRIDSDSDQEDDSPSQSPYASDGANGSYRRVPIPMSPQLVPSSPDSDGLLSTYSGLPPSSTPPPTCPLPLLRAVDERPMAYFRDLAFSNSLRLGICFTPLKEKFVRNGDLSGRVVHPWFVYYMNVMGVHLHQETRHQWLELKTQGMLTQILLRIVLEMQETQPPTTMLHAFYFMAMACTYTHTVVPGQRYLGRCQDMIEKEGFRLVDPTWIDASLQGSSSAVDRPSPYTEEKHELVSILLNLMYLQCIHRMIYSECDGMFAELEAQLPEFERAYPEVFELSSTMLRTRTVLLVRDVFLHINLLTKRGLSQKGWLTDAVNLMSRLRVILEVLDNAVNRLDDSGGASPRTGFEQRQTYLLMSSCKLFCMTAQARIYWETSKLPVVPKGEKETFREMARDSVRAYFLIYKSFNREGDLRHLDYFTITCWDYIRELFQVLYPCDLEWYPMSEVNRQVILLGSTLRVTPAGKNISVMHSLANLDSARSPDEPNFLKEEDRLKYGL